MCGIVGYAGNIETACGKPLEVCLQGLERLEYRGYDSAGVALTAPGMDKVVVRKKAGRLKNLVEDIERKPMPLATVGIGHTRWATNGEPSDVNAHPHTSMDGKVAIIHNGIIENASQLRLDLQAEGYRFASATDTEVAAKLLGKIVDKIIADEGKPDLFKAVRRMARMLEGAFTILATDCRQPDIVVGARHDSPLVVGLGEGENFLGSDVAAFVAYTKRAMEVDQDQAVCVSADKVIVTTIQKLGLALDAGNPGNYKERLKPLRNKRMVFIFDECHRSQFGDNHKAIKDFFPNAQLFGFTGTPIFAENASYTQNTGEQVTIKLQRIFFSVSYTPILSLMPLKIATCCVSLLNTTNQRAKAPPSSTSRCASVLLWKLYWINTMLQPHSASSMRCLPHHSRDRVLSTFQRDSGRAHGGGQPL